MQLVVVIAVRNAVSAATITFTATSIIRFFISQIFLLCHTDLSDLTDFCCKQLFVLGKICEIHHSGGI
jgi:hypothetical protein